MTGKRIVNLHGPLRWDWDTSASPDVSDPAAAMVSALVPFSLLQLSIRAGEPVLDQFKGPTDCCHSLAEREPLIQLSFTPPVKSNKWKFLPAAQSSAMRTMQVLMCPLGALFSVKQRGAARLQPPQHHHIDQQSSAFTQEIYSLLQCNMRTQCIQKCIFFYILHFYFFFTKNLMCLFYLAKEKLKELKFY